MIDFPREDLVVTERVGKVAWDLAEGARMTTREIAERTGLHLRGAYHMMNKLARVLPITLDGCGQWVRADALVHRVREYPAK